MTDEANFTVVSSAEDLRQAARSGDLQQAERILSRYTECTNDLSKLLPAVLRATDNLSGNTALHLSCANGHLEIVTLLLRHKAPVDATNHSGSTPLHYASLTGQLAIAQQLLAHGATAVMENKFARTALDEAHTGGSKTVSDFLLEHVEASGSPPELSELHPA